ncbi:glycosyltransferase family 2 protein [Fulvivirga ulvae]|uniref:glycosyltransferase n=1 Tax=Fulvivirga ulvae TaxID=2904245 RepID=UPI001F456D5A|nr:glycosyltransferase family 2 protein [Fulvivirga ulvae]UII31759.1 glycosyltransferase family 2 protein [Fulvivirga ulvae]
MELIIISLGCFVTVLLLYPFMLSLISIVLAKRNISHASKRKANHFTCIVTAYKDASVAIPLIHSLLNQTWPNYDVVLVADRCNKISLAKNDRLTVVYPGLPLDAKLKSIERGLSCAKPATDHVVVFDPDNVVKQDFLSNLSRYHDAGYSAVQCKRTAKNLDNHLACLDAVGEIYKNYVERKVPHLLNCSATIAGSGISVDKELLQEFINDNHTREKMCGVIQGEDKMLQNYILSKNKKIAFNEEALVYDEKVTSNKQVQNQRARWISAYFENLKPAFSLFCKGIIKLQPDKMLLSVNSMYPPLFLLMISALAMLIINLLATGFSPVFWSVAGGICIFATNFLLVLKLSRAKNKVLVSVILIPYFIANQIISLLKIRQTRGRFLVTEKKQVQLLDYE